MKILCWNVNGLRAIARKGAFEWILKQSPDILCFQETKAHPEQLPEPVASPAGYHGVWAWAERKGYSGVAVYSRKKPKNVMVGIGEKEFDAEGRTLTCEFDSFALVNVYVPNGQPDHARVPFKMKFCDRLLQYCENLRKTYPKIILCGDFNIAHTEIDLARPKDNQDTTGFLPVERQWLDKFIVKHKYVDIFREFEPGPNHYTWWHYRPGVREANVGWRIDYFFVTLACQKVVSKAYHLPEIMGSDHCPIGLELSIG